MKREIIKRVLTLSLVLLLLTAFTKQSFGDDKLEFQDIPIQIDGDGIHSQNGQTFLDDDNSRRWNGAPGLGVKEFARDTGIAYASVWTARWFYVRNKNSRMFDTSLSDWWNNISQLPEEDDGDEFFTNFIVHPVVGSQYYLYYRAMGHSFWASALGSFIQSTLFEYTVEGLVETPSLPDLVLTPLLGVPLGFGLEETSDFLIETDFVPAKVLAHVLNPMRNLIHDRQIGIYNPFTKQFMSVGGPLTFNASSNESIKLAYPFFIESPLPIGRFMTSIEFVNLEKNLGGEFIFYSARVDVPSRNDIWEVYVQIAQSGVNEVVVNGTDVSDGFEFANLLVGGKHLLFRSSNSALSAGLDLRLPTSYKDNVKRLRTLLLYRKHFPMNLQRAWTVTPYLTGAYWQGVFSIQAMAGTDWVLNAGRLEGNSFEFMLNYAASLGANIPTTISPVLFAEFNGYSLLTADNYEKTDLFASTGVRFGRKFSPGFAMQFPLSGSGKNVAKLSFLIDFQVRL